MIDTQNQLFPWEQYAFQESFKQQFPAWKTYIDSETPAVVTLQMQIYNTIMIRRVQTQARRTQILLVISNAIALGWVFHQWGL